VNAAETHSPLTKKAGTEVKGGAQGLRRSGNEGAYHKTNSKRSVTAKTFSFVLRRMKRAIAFNAWRKAAARYLATITGRFAGISEKKRVSETLLLLKKRNLKEPRETRRGQKHKRTFASQVRKVLRVRTTYLEGARQRRDSAPSIERKTAMSKVSISGSATQRAGKRWKKNFS